MEITIVIMKLSKCAQGHIAWVVYCKQANLLIFMGT